MHFQIFRIFVAVWDILIKAVQFFVKVWTKQYDWYCLNKNNTFILSPLLFVIFFVVEHVNCDIDAFLVKPINSQSKRIRFLSHVIIRIGFSNEPSDFNSRWKWFGGTTRAAPPPQPSLSQLSAAMLLGLPNNQHLSSFLRISISPLCPSFGWPLSLSLTYFSFM